MITAEKCRLSPSTILVTSRPGELQFNLLINFMLNFLTKKTLGKLFVGFLRTTLVLYIKCNAQNWRSVGEPTLHLMARPLAKTQF